MSKEKLSTLPKNHANKSSIISLYSYSSDNMNIDKPSDQMDADLQETTKVNSNNYDLRTSSEGTESTTTGKGSKIKVDPFATCLHVKSLQGFMKKRRLKATIKATMQAHLCLSIEQKKDNSYQVVCEEKLDKIIQSLMSTYETSAIAKQSEHTVKFQNKFTFLKDEAFNETKQLPKSHSKTMQFFHRGKPKNDNSKISTNLRDLHS